MNDLIQFINKRRWASSLSAARGAASAAPGNAASASTPARSAAFRPVPSS